MDTLQTLSYIQVCTYHQCVEMTISKLVGKTDGATEKGLGHKVVMDLVSGYRYQGYTVYMDNYYTSPSLFEDLKQAGFRACGTVRCDRRGIKKSFKEKVLSTGKH